jgi:diguanylate cyclase (GGDEF)-like protein
MNLLKKLRNYICYCGIEKEEYNKVKKDAYASNYDIWKILHYLMIVVFGFLFVVSLFTDLIEMNRMYYFLLLLYSVFAVVIFHFLDKREMPAQFVIYASIIALLLFGCMITQNKPDKPATTFLVLLIITPMFMIDKPYFMTVVLLGSSSIYLVWMYFVKSYETWSFDVVNIVTYTAIGIFLHVISSSIRIKEFVLTRKINIQKDTDELTGINNKAAVTRGINEYLKDKSQNKGVMIILDVDRFKAINDNYGHDVGDSVISQMGTLLKRQFVNDEIIGRFGGDEFLVFVKNTDSKETAAIIADNVISDAAKNIKVVDGYSVSVSLGMAIYQGEENNYSEIFKKADIALYRAKADKEKRYCIYQ